MPGPRVWPETVDRVVAAVGRVAITASDVEQEYRLEYFLDQGRLPDAPPDRTTWRHVRDQLIDQQLIAQESAAEGATPAEVSVQVADRMAAIHEKFSDEASFQAELKSLNMNEAQLIDRLTQEEQELQYINERLRPMVNVPRSDIEDYYHQTFLPEYARRGEGTPPPLDEVDDQIREILVQKKINELLPDWLERLRASLRVRVHMGNAEQPFTGK